MGKLMGNAKDIVWITCGHLRIMSGNESSAARTRCNRDADIWRIQRGCGLDADTDCPRTRSWRGHELFASRTRSRTGHGLGQEAAYGADILRPNRDYFADTKTLSAQGVGRAPPLQNR
jgi:hypothetical protein